MALNRDELNEWQRLKSEAAALQRQKKTVDDRVKQLEERFEVELSSSGKQSIKRHGFLLAWKPGYASVSWAKEYLDLAGPEKVQELKDNAAANARPSLVISVPE